MKEKAQWTPKEVTAIKCSIELWTWIAETGKDKGGWPEWKKNGGQYPRQPSDCFLCELAQFDPLGETKEAKCQVLCPYGETYGICFSPNYPFTQWRNNFFSHKDESKAGAQTFLQQLKDLLPPEEEEIKVGDYVKVVGKSYSHTGKTGEVIEIQTGNMYIVKFPDKYVFGHLLQSLKRVPPPRKFKVGDKVRVVSGCEGLHNGKVGEVGEVLDGNAKFDYLVKGLPAPPTCKCKESELELELAPTPTPAPAPQKKLIYIAGALSTLSSKVQDTRSPSKVVTDYISNMSNMVAHAVDVVEAGGVPYVPALDIWLGFYDGRWDEDTYRDISKRFLEACDGVFVGKMSKGVEAEIKYAESLGKPIFFSYSGLRDFIKEATCSK